MSPERGRRNEELFVEAEPPAPSERYALLERACAGDDELRLEVEALIADSGGDTAPFAGVVADAAAALAELPRPTSSAAASAATGSPAWWDAAG